MKKLRITAILLSLMLILALTACNGDDTPSPSNERENNQNQPSDNEQLNENASFAPVIEADGKTLALPCTFGEMLDFGFTLDTFMSTYFVDLPDLTDPDSLVYATSHALISWTDGSKYIIILDTMEDWETSIPAREAVLISIWDATNYYIQNEWVVEGEPPVIDALSPNAVKFNSVQRHEYLDEAKKRYENIPGFNHEDHRFDIYLDELVVVINGYQVDMVMLYVNEDDIDGNIVLQRSIDFGRNVRRA